MSRVSLLPIYSPENQKNWDMMVQPLTKKYSCQIHYPTAKTRFTLVALRHPPESTTIDSPTALDQTRIAHKRYSTATYSGTAGSFALRSQWNCDTKTNKL